jgi:GH15 family glucan-1,4-alpha-glucosidase
MYPYGLVGNGQISALIHSYTGSLDWLCLPRPDSEPVFGQLLDPDGGSLLIELLTQPENQLVGSPSPSLAEQRYIDNTNILVTELSDPSSNSRIRITDFCPRFEKDGRVFRPPVLIRKVEPITGAPYVRVRCNPINGWKKEKITWVRADPYLIGKDPEKDQEVMRILTDIPLTYLESSQGFSLQRPAYLLLTQGDGSASFNPEVLEDWLLRTRNYWINWVKNCSIPSLYQDEVIRSALILKLHCYDDTGAILAATTTSLPEEVGGNRNWDYRFCWLRDSYFVLSAFHQLGHFEEMEAFLKYLLEIARHHEHSRDHLHPVYTLDRKLPLPETQHPQWKGYRGSSPIRSFNQAAEHIQNDVYGEMILALAPIFFDDRFRDLRTTEHEDLLIHLAHYAARSIGSQDAGLWEIRDGWQEHSFTNLMSWAGLDRIRSIRSRGYLKSIDSLIDLPHSLAFARERLKEATREGWLRNGPKDPSADASLIQAAMLRYPDKEVVRTTTIRTLETLTQSQGFLYRYRRTDDFGSPQSAFLCCSFWAIQALLITGERDKACAMMERALQARNSLGLFSEHFEPNQHQQLGNFPQTYSHVGLIQAAFRISPDWEDIL